MEHKSPLDATSRHPFEVTTGRRSTDGRLRAEIFTDEMLAISVESSGAEMATRLLTLEQARILRDSLSELIRVMEASAKDEPESASTAEPWSGAERRAQAG